MSSSLLTTSYLGSRLICSWIVLNAGFLCLHWLGLSFIHKKPWRWSYSISKFRFCPCQRVLIVVIFIKKKVIYRNIRFISIVKLIINIFPHRDEVDMELDCAVCRIFMFNFIGVMLYPQKKPWRWSYSYSKFRFCPYQRVLIVVIFIKKKVIYRNIRFISIVKLIIDHFLPWVEVDM